MKLKAAKPAMRYQEISEARRWRHYEGRWHRAKLARSIGGDDTNREVFDCDVSLGSVLTGRTQTFAGHYVRICAPQGATGDWLGEHSHSLFQALLRAAEAAHLDEWMLLAVGLTPQFTETGLSQNSGFGIHSAFPERHVHMLELPPTNLK